MAAYTSLVIFTIRRFTIYDLLHRNVTVLLGRQGIALGGELCQTAANAETGVARLDDIVDVAVLGSLLRIGKELVVLALLLSDAGLDILAGLLLGLGFLGVEHGGGTAGTHHGNLG